MLTREPYHLSFPEIAELTDYQLAEVLSDPERRPARRRPHGRGGRSAGSAGPADPREEFVGLLAREGVSRADALAAFARSFPHYRPGEVTDAQS